MLKSNCCGFKVKLDFFFGKEFPDDSAICEKVDWSIWQRCCSIRKHNPTFHERINTKSVKMPDCNENYETEISEGRNLRTVKCKFCRSVILKPAMASFATTEVSSLATYL